MMLLNVGITAPVTAALSTVYQLRAGPSQRALPNSMSVQSNFTYGSSGTSVDAWLQTSLDGATTWCDVAHFAYTTSSIRNFANLYTSTSLAITTAQDGSLGASSIIVGLCGPLWRVKYTTAGTYATSTNLRIDIFANGMTSLQSD